MVRVSSRGLPCRLFLVTLAIIPALWSTRAWGQDIHEDPDGQEDQDNATDHGDHAVAGIPEREPGALELSLPRFGASVTGDTAHPNEPSTPATPEQLALDRDAEALEGALFDAYVGFDMLKLLGIFRSAITGVNEAYCAVENLLPQEDGMSTIGVLFGLGCLAASATLLAITVLRVNDLNSDDDARDRLHRFQRARRTGLTRNILDSYEDELVDAADDANVLRIVGVGIGVASLIAAAVVLPLSATGDIDPAAGVAIGTGSILVGGMSLIALGIDSPAETALERFRSRAEYTR